MANSTADYFISLSNKLSEEHRVIVITNKIRKTNISLSNNITVLKLPTNKVNSWRNFWFLYKLVRTHKPDMMISMFSFVNLFLIVGWLFRVKVRVAWIRTLSSQYAQKKYKVLRKSIIYSLSTNIITNSEATKNDTSGFFRIPKTKITVLPNSVKDYSGGLNHIKTDRNNLLYVGRLHPSKGVDILLQSFSTLSLNHPDIYLIIIGDGPLLKELVNITNSLNISDKVSFLGEKDKASVLEAYKRSYCTIIPSYSEAFGFTVIEAMSVGTCVVGANNTGIKEIIKHNKSGILFETGNSLDLAQKLEKLLLNLDYRNDLADEGYRRFKSNYENSFAINRDIKFFKKFLVE
ncbi:glycosyltransferase family 4 protein [Xanthomarina sp. F1114]|uniref:glycosyltransferase family 4 protein n=1 Tax=Xanthomarina sp. F1114 TaxID=2996019 RepID=UPI00225E0431|nr:glycosyltransferase family 4 protein [Xanthomarina sp. F1114]MCX7549070.1 glycosyltransferase family 4 protein [Xanthomarina sp. F1114]